MHFLDFESDPCLIGSSAVLRSERQYTTPGPKQPDIFEELEFQLSAIYPSITFHNLEVLADKVYHRYMTSQAYESTLGDTERPLGLYGEGGEQMEATDEGVEKLGWKGDRQMANLVLRMRDGLWYYEFCHAIVDGDIGRVSEIIKVSDQISDPVNILPQSTPLGPAVYLLGFWSHQLWQ